MRMSIRRVKKVNPTLSQLGKNEHLFIKNKRANFVLEVIVLIPPEIFLLF